MNVKFQNKYRIESARLKNWDYTSNAAYFITICTANREHFFGEIVDQKMKYSNAGIIANVLWYEIPNHAPNVQLGEFVVMPNHIHGILKLNNPVDHNQNGLKGADDFKETLGLEQLQTNQMGTKLLFDVEGVQNMDDLCSRNDVRNAHNENDVRIENGENGVRNVDNVFTVGNVPIPVAVTNSDDIPDANSVVVSVPVAVANAIRVADPDAVAVPVFAPDADVVAVPVHVADAVPVQTLHATSLQNQNQTQPPPPDALQLNAKNEFMASISPKPNSIATIIRSYKSAVTKHANRLELQNGWQPRFHDHIIRDAMEYQRISDYIKNNPKQWKEDKFFTR